MTARIQGHRLDVPFHAAADHGARLIMPTVVLVHYTASAGFLGAESTLTTKDDNYVSAHLLIDRDGRTEQMVPFDTQAYHAGESNWGGRTHVNAFSFGIELVNPGYSREGVSPPWPTQKARHKSGGPVRDWYTYPDAQISALNGVIAALFEAYASLQVVIGHDDVAPKRKLDPGPAFPWGAVVKGR